MSTLAFIGLGSNLATPVDQIMQALAAIAALPNTRIEHTSSLYASRPMGPQDQPDYVNAVVSIQTTLSPLALLDALQKIELEQGRVRKAEQWGPRTLDLDILLYGDEIIDEPRLRVPHYGMKEREFVLIPLFEISPEIRFPCGESISVAIQNIQRNGLSKLPEHSTQFVPN
ncbi:2-amino-4-hydroxy-6-hydroxymethyldihydropteridine diphosphokinase [Aestuariibacter sp. AA17]|uniref:2-amino-4-hydroxy-6-hydroxymethyldihydropteridine pyrophosphokinase n=1 Tax=Fluctibacter corallii TaxID=2984329 RepID=A0ABT3AAL1_9ALTE|nr:2-amino-4-hydroxy-6-hydroxymethyldihydropteridine diphosphokinase [Aestuariibacter sp. AA17]MCV2885654.1 2-amino-4-hydroxy-6-hydroxymethyldihydropteridine diphosphokinase [Aestuariibacter sp. AA17]